MKSYIAFILFLINVLGLRAQGSDAPGLRDRLEETADDTLRLVRLDSLSITYAETIPDSSLFYAEQEIDLSRKLNYRLSEALGMNNKGYALLNMGNYPSALQLYLSAIQIASDPKNEKNILPARYRSTVGIITSGAEPGNYRYQVLGWLHFNLGILYENARNSEKELFHYRQALQLGGATGNLQMLAVTNLNLGRLYLSLNKIDSALIFEKKAHELASQLNVLDYAGSIFLNLGRVYLASGDKEKAVEYVHYAIKNSSDQKYYRGVIAGNLLLANLNIKDEKKDSASFYANTALTNAIELNLPDLLLRSYITMADYYKLVNNTDSIVKYQNLIIKFKDSLFNSAQARQFQNIDFNEAQRQQELEAAKKDYRDRLQKYILVAVLAIFLIIAILLWRSNYNKQKANRLLKEQKQETDFQKVKVEKALADLKATQSQLIQSAKMASLGDLTAGIAHEIQNPLNFVNNFSEVNRELIEELNAERLKPKAERNDEIENGLLNDLIKNEEKINHHGKRADAIVKGMLLHSRAGSGQKEPTDINALCNENLRLSYHGLRAKDKSFNARFETNFDNNAGKINIVPQDIGRVILNLANNAFYEVSEKQKAERLKPHAEKSTYEALVSVSTKKTGDKILISVKDNGNGIPEAIKEKIFQPFFTTKPTGQGTGLGLSLSFDLVKAHGGEIIVETKEGKGSEFVISLPEK